MNGVLGRPHVLILSLANGMQEDEPTCSTPRRRSIEVPTESSINALCAPSLDILLNEFRSKNAANGPEKLSKVFPEDTLTDSPVPVLVTSN